MPIQIRLANLAALAVFTVLSIGACGGDDSAPPPAPTPTPPPGRGSDTCRSSYQYAMCSIATRCGAPSTFCDQVKSIYCKSDADAQRCGTAISSATCTTFPTGCDLPDMADPAPAKKACDELQATLCQRNEECSPGSYDACLAMVRGQLNCANALGITLMYETCLSDIRKIACDAPTSPVACTGVVLLKAGPGELEAPPAEQDRDVGAWAKPIRALAEGAQLTALPLGPFVHQPSIRRR